MNNDEPRQWYRHNGPVGPLGTKSGTGYDPESSADSGHVPVSLAEPVFAEKGEGAWLEDESGNRFLDFSSGGSAPLGYSPDVLRGLGTRSESAEDSVMFRAAPGADGVVWQSEVRLMHKLAELVPGGMNRRVLICESGREALARAIELARNETNRTNVTYLSGCSEDKPAVGKDVAAVVAHPLDGRIRQVRQACDAAGALLIDDEVGIGPGTTGRMFAIELTDVRPDVYVLGRGWAAGLPFGACVTRSSNLRWKSAPAGNPVGSAAVLETIRLLESGLLEQSRTLAVYLEKRLGALSSPRLGPELWGVGLVRTVAFRKGVAEGFAQKCRELGLLLAVLGRRGPSPQNGDSPSERAEARYSPRFVGHVPVCRAVAVRPPLVATEKDIDFAADVVGKVLVGFDKEAGRGLGKSRHSRSGHDPKSPEDFGHVPRSRKA